jgi:hypothetical protein
MHEDVHCDAWLVTQCEQPFQQGGDGNQSQDGHTRTSGKLHDAALGEWLAGHRTLAIAHSDAVLLDCKT